MTRVARLLAWPAVGVALCGFVWLTKVQARGWTPRTKLEVVLLALAAIVPCAMAVLGHLLGPKRPSDVKFSVYVKEGRASLKATPVRD